MFEVPFVRRTHSQICFVAGLLLGYYGSRPLFAFSHHLVVWLTASKVYPGWRFSDYGVLGDDVVISDPHVAPIYADYIRRLGVSISQSKSPVSDTGCLEFAKRFWVNKGTRDLSPVSLRCLLNYFHLYGLIAIHHRYGVRRRFSTQCRIGGSGYRTLSALSSSSSKVIKRIKAMWSRTLLPLSWWIGRGKPLNPYLYGYLAEWLRKELKPQDLRVVPDQYFEQPGMKDFKEWSSSFFLPWLRRVTFRVQ